jgi:hypothetical protein
MIKLDPSFLQDFTGNESSASSLLAAQSSLDNESRSNLR